MADTVVQLADDQLTKAKDAQTAGATALAAAVKASQEAAAKVAALANQLSAEHAKGRELQAAPRPTAAAARELARQQEEHEIRLHVLTAKLAAASEEAARAEALNAEAQAGFARVQARVTELEQFKNRADADAKAWKTINDAVQAVRDRAQTIPAAVDELKDSDAYKQAEQRVNEEVPQKLRVEGRKRADDVRAKTLQALDDEQAALTTLATKNKNLRGKLGEVVPARLAFEGKQRQVREIAGIPAELDQIKSQLEAIVNAPKPQGGATADIEAAGKQALADLPALRPKATDTATKVADQKQAMTDKEKEVADKKKEIADAAAGTDLVPLQDALQKLEEALQKLEDDLPELETKAQEADEKLQAAIKALDRWEASVDEAAWQRLLAFDAIKRRLDELKVKFTPAKIDDLRDDLKTQETKLVTALETEAAARGELDAAEATAARNTRLAAAAREVHDVNQLAAVRGDA